jgi:hypothetical protein
MTGRIVIDERPPCKAEGIYAGDPVPCDLHEGHEGKHEWTKPLMGPTYVWTDSRPQVREPSVRRETPSDPAGGVR